MSRNVWMGIDIGTSGAKCLLVDEHGTPLARAVKGYPLATPRPGWAEQRPEDWVEAGFACIREALAASGLPAASVAGIACSGQMHGLVALDAGGRVIRPAILWCDQRTEKQCAEITETAGGREALLRLTNNEMLTGYTGGKLLWLREEEPEHFAAMTGFLCPKDYLRFRLTGVRAMDVSEASGTGLMDTRRRAWCWELIDALGLDRSLFPPLCEATDPAGCVTAEAAAATGLLPGTPVFAGGGDAVVQSFGSGLVSEGTVGTVIGTAGNVSMGFSAWRENPGGRLQAFCGIGKGAWMSFGATQTAGGALRWFRDEACRDLKTQAAAEGRDIWDVINEIAASSPPGANGVVFAPYLSGERCPYPDASARGVLYGLSLSTTRADMLRGVMEGIVCSLRQIVDIYRSFVPVEAVIASGGGAASPLFLQMQADQIGLPVRTVSCAAEGGAYGAALIAGLGLGAFHTPAEAVAHLRTEREVLPDPAGREAAAKTFEIYRRLYPALRECYHL